MRISTYMRYHGNILMKKSVVFLMCLVLLSCQEKANDTYYPTVELNNPIVEREILGYCEANEIDKKKSPYGDKSVVFLYVREINDSIKRFMISMNSDPFITPISRPFVCSCKVGKYDVFVSIPAVWRTTGSSEPYLKLTEESVKDFQKRFFPKAYNEVEKTGSFNLALTHDKCRFLTFFKDSLIDKRDILGHPYTKIKVRVGDKYIEY